MEALMCDRCGKLIPRVRASRHDCFSVGDIHLIDGVIDDREYTKLLCRSCFDAVCEEIDEYTKDYRL